MDEQPRLDLDQWYLDPELARRIVDWVIDQRDTPARDMVVLEPSAGRGALARPLVEFGAQVVCVDIDPRNVAALQRDGLDAYEGNFLEMKPIGPSFDAVISNPPFSNGLALPHILHMLLFAPHVFVHVPLTTLAGQDRHAQLWTQHDLEAQVIHSTRPKYGPSGGMTEMTTLHIARRGTPTNHVLHRPKVYFWL